MGKNVLVKVIFKYFVLIVLIWKNSFVGFLNVFFGKISLILLLIFDVIVMLLLVVVNDFCFVWVIKIKVFSFGRLKGIL